MNTDALVASLLYKLSNFINFTNSAMQRKINPFYTIYEFLVFWPIAVVITTLTAVITIAITPFSKSAKWGYYPAIVWARLMCAVALIRVKIEGHERYNQKQSYIFVANHQSAYDIFPIYGYIGNRFVWIMKKELQSIPLVGKACSAVGHIFIDRSSAIKSKHSIEDAERKLTNGMSVVIFPEGSRTRTGEMGRFKRGAFSIAADLHLPVVPITINGAYNVLPAGSVLIKPGTIELIFHDPIDTTDLTHENLNEFLENTRNIIANDLKD